MALSSEFCQRKYCSGLTSIGSGKIEKYSIWFPGECYQTVNEQTLPMLLSPSVLIQHLNKLWLGQCGPLSPGKASWRWTAWGWQGALDGSWGRACPLGSECFDLRMPTLRLSEMRKTKIYPRKCRNSTQNEYCRRKIASRSTQSLLPQPLSGSDCLTGQFFHTFKGEKWNISCPVSKQRMSQSSADAAAMNVIW